MRDVEERAEAVLAALPGYAWDGDRLPVPVADSAFAAALPMPQWLFGRCGGGVAALCATFGSSLAATERRIAGPF